MRSREEVKAWLDSFEWPLNSDEREALTKLIDSHDEMFIALTEVQRERDFVVRCNDYIKGTVDKAIAQAWRMR